MTSSASVVAGTCTGILRLNAKTSMPRLSGSESHLMLRCPAHNPHLPLSNRLSES